MRRQALPFVVLGAASLLGLVGATASAGTATKATYTAYQVGFNGGEPTIGYDTKADAAMFGAGLGTMRMHWDAKNRLTTKRVDAPTSFTTLDSITFTDPVTNRTFSSMLAGFCSLTSYSDDAGATWHPSEGCGADVFLDHQTFGGGPYRTESKPPTTSSYGRAVYYCAQNSFNGDCARSDDGGVTFLPGTPAYNTPLNSTTNTYGGACSAIHGHVRVAPDGYVYLPNKGCGGTPIVSNLTNSEFFGGHPALSVSADNGITWTVHEVNWPNDAHNADESDPSVDADKRNNVFFGWEDGTNPSETTYGKTSSARISVSHDHGVHWTKPVDLSTPLGLHNIKFPEVIAGDEGRAAMAFLGTKAIGDDQHNGFVGSWDLYVSTTIDGGKTWSTVDTTPKDPVQRGCIDMQGTSNKTVTDTNICSQRNLLDFNDITIDKAGRVLVAYSDGCVLTCVTDSKSASKTAVDMVMRQTTGPLLRVTHGRPVIATPPRTGPLVAGGRPGKGTLASTGGAPAVAAGALVLMLGGVLLRRRRT